jgi:TRAP-type C4-dicarboxylate transport system permease small subunit
MNNNTGRSSLMAIAGGYIIYLAYELLKNLLDNVPTTMPRAVQILAIILFAGAGCALLVFAWKLWKKGREDQDQNPVDLESQEAEAKSEEQGPKT